jgi:protein tyrosine phosphatase (PTP) superfamily phosphohydrolase (DUF442 family)
MKNIFSILWVIAFSSALFSATALAEKPATTDSAIDGLRNGQWVSEQVAVGGAPSALVLTTLAESGLGVVINLQTAREITFDEQAVVEGLGDLTEALLKTIHNALPPEGQKKVLVHCASGNRVGAAFALVAHRFEGATASEALAVGKQHGLSHLEGKVAARLQDTAK